MHTSWYCKMLGCRTTVYFLHGIGLVELDWHN